MNVRHINCGTMCPLGARLVNGSGGVFERGRMVCHVFVVETPDGIALVDTGIGLADIADPQTNLGTSFVVATGAVLDPEETAARQVVRLGYTIDDVRHLIVTHLDLDHAGGLHDFPKAAVHVHAREHRAAMARATAMERERYKPVQWAHGPGWVLHEEEGEPWFGFASVREIVPKTSDVLLVPLVGHTRGHAAVAVKSERGWLLHAGDAYFSQRELDTPPSCPQALALFQRIVATDDDARLRNQARLRELKARHDDEVTIVSAHDPDELARERAKEPRIGDRAAG